MTALTRKQFLRKLASAILTRAICCQTVTASESTSGAGTLLIPHPAKPWTRAQCLIGHHAKSSLNALKGKNPSFSRLPLYNDFCITSDGDGRWHCIGTLFEGTTANTLRQDRLFHYVSDHIQGPYRPAGRIDLGYGKRSGVWAPFIFRDSERSLMFYALATDSGLSIRVAQALDRQLMSWARVSADEEVISIEPANRDPQVLRDTRTGLYLLYYVAALKTQRGYEHVVRVRTSTNLTTWGAPRTVLGTPPGYIAPESVFVVQTGNYYYMWISSAADYGVVSLYISEDPFNFGDASSSRVEEQSGHAPEIVQIGQQYWIACVAIASVRGLSGEHTDLPLRQHDLEGVYLQPLEWRIASPQIHAKVTQASRAD